MANIAESKARAATARDATAQEEDVGGRYEEDGVADVTKSMARAVTAVTRRHKGRTSAAGPRKTS